MLRAIRTHLRRMLYASQASVRKRRYWSLSAPPMASIISLFSFMGGGKGLGSRPAKHCWCCFVVEIEGMYGCNGASVSGHARREMKGG